MAVETHDVPRIDVNEARPRVERGQALLVCAYADEAKCDATRLAGSITLGELEARRPSLSKDQQIIFYCA